MGEGTSGPVTNIDRAPSARGISEKIWVKINGIEQGMFIRSRDSMNPVLLFLHGGPGMPEFFLTKRYTTGLEELFTVVWWEQRGTGLSYSKDIPPETMTVEQFILDTLAMTNHLRDRFGQDKIYLMAHSGGSFYGIQAVARAPELFHAYIGVAQMSYQLRSEMQAYSYMLDRYRENGNRRMVRRLEKAAPSMTVPLPPSYDSIRDKAMHRLGIGTTRDMRSVVTGVFIPSWLSGEYTLREKMDIWRGKFFSMRLLRDTIFATDLTGIVKELEIPIYFFSGKHDHTVSYTEARSYFEGLKAPLKGFYTFELSAHSPMFEEPEKMRTILREDVLASKIDLADAL
ncbi:MAG TPA: alpha/beta hydrolase [Methanomassiliicoccales archaeon]|jgi:pimeloyl-ACP methyl ester carboxylesterase